MTNPDYSPEPETELYQTKFLICKIIQEDPLYRSLSFQCQANLVDFLDFKDKIQVDIGWSVGSGDCIKLYISVDPDLDLTLIRLPLIVMNPVRAQVFNQLLQQVTNLACKIESMT